MEFNSPGYYREHLWALLNLVDFALDEEVRTKATMAVDLMLFDVIRYLHRGAMGAAGGRSQFKFKSHGFDNGLTDVVEMMLGVKGVFSEGDAQVAASFASSTYVVPQVLLEIGAAPPTYPFTDRSRVSIVVTGLGDQGLVDARLRRKASALFAVPRRGQRRDRAHPQRLRRGGRRHRVLLGHVGLRQQAGGAQQLQGDAPLWAQQG
jgi:hypothetical protein